MPKQRKTTNSKIYSTLGLQGAGYLAFKNIPKLLENYVSGTLCLDYGCGSGRSARFLTDIGFHACDVDIDSQIIEVAKATKDGIQYGLIETDHPLGDKKNGYAWVSEQKFSPYVTYVLKNLNRFLHP
jgi:2-polyprenyl-3-methyl-5-hydroxy-6-metoxy-1,4-benzoquinol methylase